MRGSVLLRQQVEAVKYRSSLLQVIHDSRNESLVLSAEMKRENLTTIPINSILTSKAPLFVIHRPWSRFRRLESPTKILVLTRKNYKVHADIAPTVGLMRRTVAVFYTGADPNLIRNSELPPGMEAAIIQGPSWDLVDANNRPPRTVGLIRLSIRLGSFLTRFEFIMCEKVAVPLILEADYCNKHVHSIFPRTRKVELADGNELPIISTFTPRKSKSTVEEVSKDESSSNGRPSSKVKVAKPTVIEFDTQNFISCVGKRDGFLVVQPYDPLHEAHHLVATNGIVKVQAYEQF